MDCIPYWLPLLQTLYLTVCGDSDIFYVIIMIKKIPNQKSGHARLQISSPSGERPCALEQMSQLQRRCQAVVAAVSLLCHATTPKCQHGLSTLEPLNQNMNQHCKK